MKRLYKKANENKPKLTLEVLEELLNEKYPDEFINEDTTLDRMYNNEEGRLEIDTTFAEPIYNDNNDIIGWRKSEYYSIKLPAELDRYIKENYDISDFGDLTPSDDVLASKMKKQSAIVDFDLVDKLREYLDDTTILEDLVRALGSYETRDALQYIARCYDIPLE